jgi:hypothetical protein
VDVPNEVQPHVVVRGFAEHLVEVDVDMRRVCVLAAVSRDPQLRVEPVQPRTIGHRGMLAPNLAAS